MCNSAANQRGRCHRALQHEAYTGHSTRECGEKALQRSPRKLQEQLTVLPGLAKTPERRLRRSAFRGIRVSSERLSSTMTR